MELYAHRACARPFASSGGTNYPGPPGGIVPLLESGGLGGRSLERWMLDFGILWKSFVGVSEKLCLKVI